MVEDETAGPRVQSWLQSAAKSRPFPWEETHNVSHWPSLLRAGIETLTTATERLGCWLLLPTSGLPPRQCSKATAGLDKILSSKGEMEKIVLIPEEKKTLKPRELCWGQSELSGQDGAQEEMHFESARRTALRSWLCHHLPVCPFVRSPDFSEPSFLHL